MKVIIIGGGQVGSYITDILVKHEIDVKVIESREKVLQKIRGKFSPDILVEGDGSDPVIMSQAGMQDCDVVVCVTGKDEVNLVSATIAKYEFGVDRVIARVNHPSNEWLFTLEMGVDVKVNQAELLARLVVDEIDMRNVMTLMKLNRGEYSISQITVEANSMAIGKEIKDLAIPDKAVLIAITRNHEVVIPKGNTTIESNDHIMFLCYDDQLEELNALFA
ncbi:MULTISPECIES: TrkA family potassium uptake protein [Breznakia]|uniref:Trk system potassium uptake protein TrkA n=1 Tax=Breznakia blatticola TaxID=1754012 RepID=A0A4R8AD34_9FIRM|nr:MULTISPECIES: TrkA family potassium uptake protein [Breznakia]MDH6365976.1 trk system potassium uptake protein TrkA [Breznakia sp. PH1-1]MDH6403092.1 trk system potassium uptake protein TrkA [Breznakia sp. PF1-11]MDH6410801.1 trk system potassium uptake protein TrkA [Breznakia sp. PFB1-11]MDH6413142.1 trk system potassium uptake protein TrkA [Breznakia sp. PFB1-14]MDH6415510.1 trk system potassium uptake protein TrkA [Breznakia sp. PFB1-4]